MIKIAAVIEAARSRGFGEPTVYDETAETIELGGILDRSEGRARRRDVGVGIHQLADGQARGIDGLGALEHDINTFVSSKTGSMIKFRASVEKSLRSQFLT